jgi:hypothetical protein
MSHDDHRSRFAFLAFRGSNRTPRGGAGAAWRPLPVLLALVIGAPAGPAAAQGLNNVNWFHATGRFSSYGELYGRSGVGQPARPGQTGRINADMTFSFANGLLVVPVGLILSTDQVAVRQSINQIGISPTWRWATVHIGHFSPQYSPYSFTDATLLGGGAEVKTNLFRVGVIAGKARDAIAPTPGQIVVPEYQRSMQGSRLGVGHADGLHLDAFFLHAQDDPGSIDTTLLTTPLTPEANTVTALNAGAPLGARVRVEGDLAFSRYQADRRVDFDAVRGQAARLALDYAGQGGWTAGVQFEQVNGGFHDLGNTGLKNDRRDIRLRGQGRLWKGRLALNGSVGLRQDNLSDALDVTNHRTIANFAGTFQPVPAFGVDFQVANDRQQASALIASRSQHTVTGNYTITPRLVLRTGRVQHVLFGMAAFQSAVSTSPGTTTEIDTRTHTLVANWSATLPSGLTLNANVTRAATEFQLDTLSATTTITTFSPGAAYSAVQGKLQASFHLQFTGTRLQNPATPTTTATHEVFPVLQVRYAIDARQSLVFKSSYRRYDMSNGATLPGDPQGTGTFTERIVSLGYTVSLR